MKALILNSGLGHRMGVLTSEHPKCMTEISTTDTILSRQLRLLADLGITEVVMTTGYFDDILVNYCHSLDLPLHYTFVKNPLYDKTNYIYSIYCAKEYLMDEDIILMHGDLVFEESVLEDMLNHPNSCMKVSSTLALPEKDFKAVVIDGKVKKVGVEFFTDAMEAQALYKLNKKQWRQWLEHIIEFCESDRRKCYAEAALNEITDLCEIDAFDVKYRLCAEIDTPEDLAVIKAKLDEIENRIVYMCFSTDVIHGAHIDIIRKARRLGKLVIGILSDQAVADFKRVPFLPSAERKKVVSNLKGVYKVIEQETLSYADVLNSLKPTYVVHGDNWRDDEQQEIRKEVINILAGYGGRLVEFPFAQNEEYRIIERKLNSIK